MLFNKIHQNKFSIDVNMTPVAIKGYNPDGGEHMFVFTPKKGKLYAARLASDLDQMKKEPRPIRCGIATVLLDDEAALKYGNKAILIDKEVAGLNNFLNRKELLAMIHIENCKHSLTPGVTLDSNLANAMVANRTMSAMEAMADAARIYGHRPMKNAVLDADGILIDGMKPVDKALHKVYKKGGNTSAPASNQKQGGAAIDSSLMGDEVSPR